MKPRFKWWYAALAICLLLVLLAPLASPAPDGLERVAEAQGFMDRAREAVFSIMPDYGIPGLGNEALSTVLAGVAGLAIVGALGYGLARLLKKGSSSA